LISTVSKISELVVVTMDLLDAENIWAYEKRGNRRVKETM